VYAVQNPFTGGLFYPPATCTWRIKKAEIKSLLEEWGSKYEERDLKDGVFSALVIKGFQNFANPQQDPLMKTSFEKAQKRLEKGG